MYNFSFITQIIVYMILSSIAVVTVNLKKIGPRMCYFFLLSAAIVFLGMLFGVTSLELSDSFYIDGNKLLLLKLVSFMNILMILLNGFQNSQKLKSSILLNFMFLGGVFLLGARELITFYVSLETMALIGYALVAVSDLEFSKEAAVKYFIQGSIVSVIFLLGAALYLGATGTLSLSGATVHNQELYVMSLGIFTLTLFFKLGAFPFHAWVADVYSNVSDGNLASNFLLSKVIIGFKFITLIQVLLLDANPHFQDVLILIIQVVAVLSAFYGNIMAVVQNQFKRIIAYSSVAHTGYMLLMVCLNPDEAYEKQLISFLVIYSLTATGVILILNQFAALSKNQDNAGILKGAFYQNRTLSILLMVFVLSLAGIPLTAGFALKYTLFTNFFKEGFNVEATSILLSSIIGLSYYIRFVSDIFSTPNVELPALKTRFSEMSVHVIILLAIISVGVFPSLFFQFN